MENPDKSDTPKEFDSLFDLKMAMVTLEGAMHKVMPWNFAYKTIYIFMVSVDFGESDLAGCDTRTQILANFVDEALRANARNWEEKKKFLYHQDLCIKWTVGHNEFDFFFENEEYRPFDGCKIEI